MSESILFIEGKAQNKDLLIVSFGGLDAVMAGIPPFEFLRTLNKISPNCDKYFIIDKHQIWYHKGIEEVSVDIPTTKDFLAKIIAPYQKVLFMGNSAGGYAAILFGSLLKIDCVLAFVPQTDLSLTNKEGFDVRYMNINSYINKVSDYVIYGMKGMSLAEDPLHHYSHCENICKHDNVTIHYFRFFDLKTWRDKGVLKDIILNILSNIP